MFQPSPVRVSFVQYSHLIGANTIRTAQQAGGSGRQTGRQAGRYTKYGIRWAGRDSERESGDVQVLVVKTSGRDEGTTMPAEPGRGGWLYGGLDAN
ncbi:hypothetical protein PG999_003373 [Apiospora kogelbergensis]|uniref:Uncharacterized protein n=1 Tax=Apiospora kogelbergensis TaxID=1337665 RepID=A0AAW0R3B1_9PEZI